MQTIEEYLPGHPFFVGLDEQAIALVAGCAVNAHVRPGEFLFREGEAAEPSMSSAPVGSRSRCGCPPERVVLDTARDGDVVGWSWLVPPYRWTFDALATERPSVIAFDGACLRGKCETDSALGYALLQRVVQVMS